MILDHIGVAVPSIAEGVRTWKALFGYHLVSPIVVNERQKVRIAFLHKPASLMVKLIEPSSPDSAIAAFTRKGGGLHHLCFRCDNLESSLSALHAEGARCLVPPEPGEAFCNQSIAFLLAPGNLNIELIDTDQKALLPEYLFLSSHKVETADELPLRSDAL